MVVKRMPPLFTCFLNGSATRFFIFLSVIFPGFIAEAYSQASLPLSRTVWDVGEPTGWSQSGCTPRTTIFACTGNNARTFDTNGDYTIVNFSSAPDQLTFKLKKASMSGETKIIVEESVDGSTWTSIGNYGTATGATAITDCGDIAVALLFTSRYVKWSYIKASGNCDLDDVSVIASSCTPPAAQATNFSTSSVSYTTMTVSWVRGNGDNVLVIAKAGSNPSDPSSGTSYTGNAAYGSGSAVGGGFAVYNGTGSSVNLTSLSNGTTYYFAVYEYANTGTCYNPAELSGSEVTLTISSSSDIIAAGNETANINYASKTASAINSTADGIRAWSFTIRDGGGTADADAVGTIVASVTINKGGSNGVTGWANTVRQAALYDGATEVAEISVTGETMAFSSISVTAPDNGNKTLDLYLTFETTNIADNEQFQFSIQRANTTTDVNGSSLAAFTDVTSSITGDDNRIEVTASKLNFVQQPSNYVVNFAMVPAVTIEAADANNMRDLDFTGSIRVTSTGTLSGSPVDVAAVSGLAAFSSLTHTVTGTGLTLNAEKTITLDWDITSNPFNIAMVSIDDYRTAGSGNWGSNTTWEKWDGSAWVVCGAGDFPDVSTTEVTIRNGHIIDNDGSGTPPWNVENLIVEAGGKLWDNAFNGGNSYIQIYGNITCNGTIGSTSGDDISFDIVGGANCTISGTGTFAVTRIRKDDAINTGSDASLTIDMDITLLWNSASGTVLFNDGTASNFNVTVNAGKTLRATAPGSNVGNISIDGANFSGPDAANSGGTYIIFGTIDTDGILYAYTDNTVAGRGCSYIIENGGTIKCRYIHTGASGSAGQVLRVKSGGTLNIYSVKDSIASADCNTWYNYSTTNNTFDFQAGSTVIYSCSNVQQNLNGPATYSNLTVSGGGLKYLTQDITVDQTLTLTSGRVQTNSFKMIMSSTTAGNLVHTSGSSSFIYGNFRRNISSNTSTYEFPVGLSSGTSGYFRADFINNNITGVTYIDASVNSITNSGNNIDSRLNTEQDGTPIDDIAETAEWNLLPDAAPSGGSYGVKLYTANISGLTDNQFCPVKRPDASADYADWLTYDAGTVIPAAGVAGRTISSGYAQRTGYMAFSKFAVGKSSAVLPVELLSFDAKPSDRWVELNWKTAIEINNDYFTVERSPDGENFEPAGYVKGSGNSNVALQYNFTDRPEVPDIGAKNIFHYRLKQTDYDGESSYSHVVAVMMNGSHSLLPVFYADPEERTISFFIGESADAPFLITITDVAGKVLLKKYFYTQQGTGRVDCSSLPAGLYFFRIGNGARSTVRKFIFY